MIAGTINHKLSDAAIFNIILKATEPYWEKQDGRKDLFFVAGNMLAWEKIWGIVFLGYNPENHRIHLNAIVADEVFETPAGFDAFIFRPRAIYERTRSRYDPENYVVVAESNFECPSNEEDIPKTVKALFTDFGNMLNDKLLYSVLQAAKTHFTGVHTDLFEKE